MTTLHVGDMNRRITLQQRSTLQDSAGQQVTTWTDVIVVWAALKPLSGRELLAAQAVQSVVSHQVEMRYQAQFANPKVMAAMRFTLVKDGVTRIFNILDARDEDENRHILTLDAVEGLNDG